MMHLSSYQYDVPSCPQTKRRSQSLTLRIIEASKPIAGDQEAPPRLRVYDRIRFFTARLANFALQTQPRTSTGMAL